ncbi:hypothetical protein AGR4A_Cc170116 [Agrobacterium tumefaciens str. B6]|uniref:Uncharacterized protein n=1 Tax=Agrobacterium tumefaciens str. B6 TaxID=1183423 RepID=A0A822UXQ7_AGRTU|nr:hypothetical protein AGR4A_Cc170116 [Agrobacterium tumefaciens str. B6]
MFSSAAVSRYEDTMISLTEAPLPVIPALSRNPVDAHPRGGKRLSSPRTWAGWIPAQGGMTAA